MIQWIVIVLLVIIGLFLLEFIYNTQKYKIIMILIIGTIIYFSIAGAFSSEKIDLSSPEGIINTGYLYMSWIGETSSKIWEVGVDTTRMVGNVIKTNNTESEDSKKKA